MKKFTYSTKNFHKNLFDSDVAIVDNEIANDISDGWNYEKGIPVVTGILYKDKILILLAEDIHDKDYALTLIKMLRSLDQETDIYAFNRHMEMGNFKGHLDYSIHIKEIKPFNGKGWNKDRFYSELIGKKIIPDCDVVDEFQGDASLCIPTYKQFLETEKIEFGMKIVKHNLNCVLKESVILKHKDYFTQNYKVNERGWLDE